MMLKCKGNKIIAGRPYTLTFGGSTLFTIKEASEKLNCPAPTIRFYDKEGLLPNIRRDDKGNRMFEQKDLDWIRLMTCFRATGMSVADLKKNC